MADPPLRSLPASSQRHAVGSDREVNEESDLVWSEARSSELPSESETYAEAQSGDSDYLPSPEELDDDDLLDSEEELDDDDLLDSDDGKIHTLSEVEMMKKKFLNRKVELVAGMAEDVITSASERGKGDADDIDADEEYRKDLEVQRLEDRKNGHFSASSEGEMERPETRNTRKTRSKVNSHRKKIHKSPVNSQPQAAYPATRVSARVAAYEACLPPRVSDGTGLTLVTQNDNFLLQRSHNINSICLDYAKDGEGAVVQYGEREKLYSKNIAAVPTYLGTNVGNGTCSIKKPLTANFSSPKSCTDSINVAPFPNTIQPSTQVKSLQISGNGNVSLLGSGDISETLNEGDLGHVNFVDSRKNALGMNMLASNEENNHLDLMEGRPTLVQHIGSALTTGPLILGSKNDTTQVSSLSGLISNSHLVIASQTHVQPNTTQPDAPAQTRLSFSKPPLPLQPNNRKNVATNFPIPKAPTTLKNKPLAQLKNKSQAPLKQILLAPSAQNKNNPQLPQSNLNSQIKQPAASLPFGSKNDTPTGTNLSVIQSPLVALSDHDMIEFPPLEPSVVIRKNADVGRNSETTIPAAVPIRTPQTTPSPSSSQPKAALFKNCWADLMEEDQVHNDGADNTSSSVRNEHTESAAGGQPNVHFGRSMADVLRSGQPAEGPILLDRERADKRGEVRIVEGKPCLYFSANETSLLAGRLGPAIVGKFSHSIPPAHQIQKALGNLKLVGAMTWNFLNAKHIFIQLSDMRDYVKMLNGPNNSPVWYVEHHPMRVFKWTPDFDPFFESPIVTLWCNILALPVHLFEESSLIAIGEMLGKPVQVDRATISRTRVSFARICVEVDLTRPIPDEIDINIAGRDMTLKVKWEKIPLYCNECKHVGHAAMTCYASGKRPMPPKRDYSHGGPNKPNAPPPGEGRPGGQPTSTPNEADRQAEESKRQASRAPERPSHESDQPHHPGEHSQGLGSPSFAGINMEATQTAGGDGFTMPKRKKRTKSAARRERERERRRLNKQMTAAGGAATSDGGGYHTLEEGDASSGSEMSTRSLSPSHRSRTVDGSLAMVVHDSNMFGALRDSPSEDDEANRARAQDTVMVETSSARSRQTDYGPHLRGHTSPPPEGTSKRARLGASSSH